MPYTIEVEILDRENAIKYVPLIRKWTKQSIMSIKNKILQGESVLISEYTKNPQSLVSLRQHILDLENNGAKIKILMNTSGFEEIIDMEMIDNSIRMNDEVSKEIDELMDLEARAMEEDD